MEGAAMRNQTKRTDTQSDPALRDMLMERARRAPMLQAKGTCWYCHEPVDNVRRFCSIECRDDYFEEESE
jgi:hypothetical protein